MSTGETGAPDLLQNAEGPTSVTATPAKPKKPAKKNDVPTTQTDAAPIAAESAPEAETTQGDQTEQPEIVDTLGELRLHLSRKYPKAEADTMLHQMQRGLSRFAERIRSDDNKQLCFAVEVTPSTILWLEEVIRELWPSRRPEM
jgi:hypothetical protein